MLIRHTLLYLPAQILGPIAQFLAIVVFTHWMAPEPYGMFTYIMASQEFVFFLCLSWWSQYTIRYFGGKETSADRRYQDAEFTIILFTIVAQVAASLLVLVLISAPITPGLATATIAYMVTRCLNLHLGERARAGGRIFEYTVATSAGQIFGFVVAFFAVSQIAATPVCGLSGFAVAQAAALVWLMMRQHLDCRIRRPDRALLLQALSFGLPLIAAGLAAWFSLNAIRILVDHRIGAEAMGLIALGWGIGHRLMTTASMVVTAAAFPLAVESIRLGSKERAYEQIVTNGLLMFGIVLPAAVGLYLLQKPLVSLVVAAPFQAATMAIFPAALAAGLFRNIRTHVADQVFILIERTSMVCLMTVIEMMCVVVGCVAGLEWDGAIGAAVGSAVGYGAIMIANFVVAYRSAGLVLPFRHVFYIICATGVMSLAIHLLPGDGMQAGGAIGRVVVVSIVGAAVYLVTIILLFPMLSEGVRSRWRRMAASRTPV